MNALDPPSLGAWSGLVAALGLEMFLVTLLAGLLDYFLDAPAMRRRVWQAAFVLFFLLLAGQLCGVPHFFSTARLAPRQLAPSVASAPSQAPAVPEALGPAAPEPALQIQPSAPQERLAASPLPHAESRIAAPAPAPGLEPARPTPLSPPPKPEGTWLPGYLWGAGSVLFFLPVLCGSAWLIFRGRRRSTEADAALNERLALMARQFHLPQPRLEVFPLLRSPVAFGLFSRVIAVPANFQEKFSPAEREAMLAHEMGHLAARDPWWKFVAEVVRALLWWHPAVWWSQRRLEAAAELAADEAASQAWARPGILAECLVRLGGEEASRKWKGALAMSGFRSGLGRRVERLLAMEEAGGGLTPARRHPPLRAGLSLLVVAALCAAWTGQAVENRIGGTNMKNGTQKTWWKKSFAHLLLTAAVSSGATQTPEPGVAKEKPRGEQWVPDLPGASNESGPRKKGDSGNMTRRELSERYGLAAADPEAAKNPPGYEEALQRRYGQPKGSGKLDPSGVPGSVDQSGRDRRAASIRQRLAETELDEISFDGLPLGEVVRFLRDEAERRDPEKRGVNFMVANGGRVAGPVAIDPVTGQPVAGPASSTADLNTVIIRINPPLKHVTLIDALEAIVKLSDEPIAYRVEPYGVMFVPKSAEESAPFGQASASHGDDLGSRVARVEAELNGKRQAAASEAEADYAGLSTTLEKLMVLSRSDRSLFPTALTVVLPEPRMTSLIDALAVAQQKMAIAERDYGPDHVEVIRYRALSKTIQNQIEEHAKGLLTGLELKVQVAKARYEKLKGDLSGVKK